MPYSVPETFEWMRERLDSDRVELEALRAENARLSAERVRLALEVARLKVRPVVEAERRGEDVGRVADVRLDSAGD